MVQKDKIRMGILGECFGATPRVRFIEMFAVTKEIDHSLGNMISYLGVSKATGYNIAKDLLEEGIIKKTRNIAGTQLYQLDVSTKKGKLLGVIFHQAIKGRI